MARLFSLGARMLGRSARLVDGIARHLGESEEVRRERAVVASTRSHDMASHPDEQHYRRLYWRWMQPYLDTMPANARCLDLGCGQGRLSVPLAQHFAAGTVVGVDLSPGAIQEACRNAAAAGLDNVSFVCSPLDPYVADLVPSSFDVLMFTEVSFFWPEWRRHFPQLVGAVRPGGLLIASFRPLYFDALCLVQQHRWPELAILLSKREGYIFGPEVKFSWQRSDEIAALFRNQPGLTLELLTGVGVCSGIEGDPHASVVRPSMIPGDRQHLEAVEFALGPSIPDAGRYMLAIAKMSQTV
jgi:SAM-dependent methyltransferase